MILCSNTQKLQGFVCKAVLEVFYYRVWYARMLCNPNPVIWRQKACRREPVSEARGFQPNSGASGPAHDPGRWIIGGSERKIPGHLTVFGVMVEKGSHQSAVESR